MSTKAIAVALVLLGLLAVGSVLALRLSGPQAGGGAAPAPLLAGVDVTRLRALSLERAGGAAVRAERQAAGGWEIVQEATGARWPGAVPGEASRAIIALANLEIADGSSFPEQAELRLRLEFESGPARVLELAPGSLGGRRMIRNEDGRVALAGDEILSVLVDPGPASWRLRGALPGAREASRIELTGSSGQRLVLARLSGRWHLRVPIGARADERAVAALLEALAPLSAIRFLDGSDAPEATIAGMDRPRLLVHIGIDRREVDNGDQVRIESHDQRLTVGAPARADGGELFAHADGRHDAWMLIGADALSAISTAARNYIEPTISDVPHEDVFMIRIRDELTGNERAFRRDGEGWIELFGNDERREADRQRVIELLEFLSDQPGEPDVSTDSTDLRTALRIELIDLNGDPLEIIGAGYTPDGALAFRSRNLLVTFDDGRAPSLLGMPEEGEVPAAPEATGSGAELPAGTPSSK